MTSALYLENYLDGLEHLPAELRRNFNLMRELDNRVQILMKTIDKECNDYMKNTSSDTAPVIVEDGRREKLKAIQDMFNKAKQLGDDKVQLAIQTYELVDKHIRRLDADLQRFEGEIQDKNPSPPEENVAKKAGRKKGKTEAKTTGKKKRAAANSSDDEAKDTSKAANSAGAGNGPVGGASKNRKQKKSAEADAGGGHLTPHPSDVLDMPVDPNEPTYCLCHQVSYGEMIGCDNELCSVEWFHFACVGLTIKPKGKWFCPKCSLELGKKKK